MIPVLAHLADPLRRRLPAGLRRRWARRWRRRIRVRPTRAGVGFVVLLAGVLVAAVNTGDNLLYAVLSGQLSVLLISNLLAELNLRGLSVRRELPGELYAGQDAVGRFVVVNARRRVFAGTVHVEELDAGGAHALFAAIAPGERAAAPARWRFRRRGLHRLVGVRVSSDFPFGLVRRWVVLPLPAEVLVYPAPAPGRNSVPALVPGGAWRDVRRPGRDGDFQALRRYQAGDPLRDLHWPTTARTGRPMVVQREGVGAPRIVVRVEPGEGERRERALSRAVGEIERHMRRGDAVGLWLDDQRLEPRTGDAWRRHLLTRLALAPPADGGTGRSASSPGGDG
ncbi:MAG: DUF58 domain-containing protein [Deltaproteobacteria bacterium]|nr:MAG: DUF58 domain-containing protein [Deltaproteobacteria bacterium]